MWLCLVLAFVLAWQDNLSAAESVANFRDPTQVLQAYVRATYARDFVDAYRFISSADHKVRDVNRYVQQRGAFNGFALEVARKLSEAIAIEPAQREESGDRIQLVAKYKVPDPTKLSSWLLNWDAFRLNSLSSGERKQIFDRIEASRSEGSLPMSTGEEKFELIKENGQWRIFLNWAAGVKIPFRLELAKSADLDVSLSKHEVVTQPGDLFEIVLTVRNRTNQDRKSTRLNSSHRL